MKDIIHHCCNRILSNHFVITSSYSRCSYCWLLDYVINYVHKIQKHIDYMYHWMSRLAMGGVYEFYMEHQMLIILNSLPKKWMSVRLSLEYRLESLDFNNLADEMLLVGNVSVPKKIYDALEAAQVVWMLLLNSFHCLSRMNLEEMSVKK